jgi:Ca2+-binding EF-hand superfamily protein
MDTDRSVTNKREELRALLSKEEQYIFDRMKPEEIDDYHAIFNIFDKDGGGSIEENEIRTVF